MENKCFDAIVYIEKIKIEHIIHQNKCEKTCLILNCLKLLQKDWYNKLLWFIRIRGPNVDDSISSLSLEATKDAGFFCGKSVKSTINCFVEPSSHLADVNHPIFILEIKPSIHGLSFKIHWFNELSFKIHWFSPGRGGIGH